MVERQTIEYGFTLFARLTLPSTSPKVDEPGKEGFALNTRKGNKMLKNEEFSRDFKGIWIDRGIWLDKRLNALEKVILAEIDSLDNGEGCYASNKYLAEFCQCTERKVSDAISKLTKLGYLKLVKFDGRTRILQTCATKKILGRLEKNSRQNRKKFQAPIKNNIDEYNRLSSFDVDEFFKAAVEKTYEN